MELRDLLEEWVERRGLARVASSLGVTERTLTGWLARGVPPRARSKVQASVRRSIAAVKAAKTRAERAAGKKGGVFQPPRIAEPGEIIIEDEYPTMGSVPLLAEELVPRYLPGERDAVSTTREGKRSGTGLRFMRDRLGLEWSRKDVKGRTRDWTIYSRVIDLPYRAADGNDFRSQLIDLGGEGAQLWELSGHTRAQFRSWIYRHIPRNPRYRGELASRKDTWTEPEAVSAGPRAAPEDIRRLPYQCFHTRRIYDPETRTEYVTADGSIDDVSNTRLFWVGWIEFAFYTPKVLRSKYETPPTRRKRR